ncbi:MAG: carbamoyltransferase HypF [Saprospiraceae bacterium]|nr:carbamoyltransferase HypF [Saprospiraceae bacterium]
METFHIHIKGMVQGVGFRPFVHQLAHQMNLSGYVSNTKNGVHIEINGDEKTAQTFYEKIILHPPKNALISGHSISKTDAKLYDVFRIIPDTSDDITDLFLTPDIAICENCKKELSDESGSRFRYPFTTCLHCGPRYSITNKLPYDRINTTMSYLHMCPACEKEYQNIKDRRYYSQTNSCPDCAVQMHLHHAKHTEMNINQGDIVNLITLAIKKGKIVAVKGTGGFLLMCDATNRDTIINLRTRKHRPAKPLAIMYPDIHMAKKDIFINNLEKSTLLSKSAPILLCRKKDLCETGLCHDTIAPGLDKIGVMMPSSPLSYLIAEECGLPLVTTSGNISGSPILYTDEDALTHLFDIADLILTYDREIIMPQDDSVMQITDTGQKIILRRSRGLAPGYFPDPFSDSSESLLAFGGELKGAFAIYQNGNINISQYLGDQQSYESQKAYARSLSQLTALLAIKPDVILIDSHPGYQSSAAGVEYSQAYKINKTIRIQHHKAHFGAVLAENGLQNINEPILGIIWDGTGYGDDHQIWGSEVFVYQNYEMSRVAHFKYFNHLMNDKMSREPRLSALSILEGLPDYNYLIKPNFNENEWKYYNKVLTGKSNIQTASMGRFLDGIACFLGIGSIQTYEGETVMKMESLARQFNPEKETYYDFEIVNGAILYNKFLEACIHDFVTSGNVSKICRKVFFSLAYLVGQLSDHFGIDRIAFSGGVFQNALLVDMIKKLMNGNKHLYFHVQLSPNDECIAFGQMACYDIQKQKDKNQALSEMLES